MRVAEMNREALEAFAADCKKQYEAFQAQGLKLDMSRGKPSPKQLDLTNGITDCLAEDDYKASNGLDCRNYGRRQRNSSLPCWASSRKMSSCAATPA